MPGRGVGAQRAETVTPPSRPAVIRRRPSAESVEDLPSSNEETDEQYWHTFRRNAEALARVVPEFAKFVQAEPSDEVLAGWREAAALATKWLTAREASLRAHEQARAATAADASLVPSGHDMRLLVRYASMNDRKIEKLLKLIEKHCGKASDVEDA
jgi:hypothetical protein